MGFINSLSLLNCNFLCANISAHISLAAALKSKDACRCWHIDQIRSSKNFIPKKILKQQQKSTLKFSTGRGISALAKAALRILPDLIFRGKWKETPAAGSNSAGGGRRATAKREGSRWIREMALGVRSYIDFRAKSRFDSLGDRFRETAAFAWLLAVPMPSGLIIARLPHRIVNFVWRVSLALNTIAIF